MVEEERVEEWRSKGTISEKKRRREVEELKEGGERGEKSGGVEKGGCKRRGN